MAGKAVRAKIARLKIHAWLQVEAEGRTLNLTVNQPALEEAARLVGCYVIQTRLPDSTGTQPRLGRAGRDRRRRAAPTADAVFDTGEGAGLRQLPAHSHAGPGRRRLTQGAGDSPARSTTPHRHPRGHTQATPRAP